MSEKQSSFLTVRRNYEGSQVKICLLGTLMAAGMAFVMPNAAVIWQITAGSMLFLGLLKLPAAIRRLRFDLRFIGCRKNWMLYREAVKLAKQHAQQGTLWLGRGFNWRIEQCQLADGILNSNWEELFDETFRRVYGLSYFLLDPWFCVRHPIRSFVHCLYFKRSTTEEMGSLWVHALGKETDLSEKIGHFAGHTLLIGTTGSGKTRALEALMLQPIVRGEPVVILDPKGDEAVERAAKKLCELCGRSNAFKRLHLAFPEKSIRLNFFANYSEPTELADRISATIEGGSSDQAFIDMGNFAMRQVCTGQSIFGEPITCRSMLKYLRERESLAEQTLAAYMKKVLGDEFDRIYPKGTSLQNRLDTLKRIYRSRSQDQKNAIDGVIAFSERDDADLTQVIQTTIGQLEKLTTGKVGELLSPEKNDNSTPFTDLRTLIQQNSVLYVGLTAMRDEAVAHTVGAAILSDLTAVASSIYAYDHPDIDEPHSQAPRANRRIWVFADEASDLVCKPFISLLNKGRGSGIRLVVATQTFADFVARLRNKDDATRVIANLNNIIGLRCNDAVTEEFITSRLQDVEISSQSQSLAMTTDAGSPLMQRGSYSKSESLKTVKLVAPSILAALPNLEYFGIFGGSHVVKGRIPVLVNSREEFRQ